MEHPMITRDLKLAADSNLAPGVRAMLALDAVWSILYEADLRGVALSSVEEALADLNKDSNFAHGVAKARG